MSQNENSAEEPGANLSTDSERDKDGKFLKGNTTGHRWTEETCPRGDQNHGRPKRKHLTDALMKHLNEKASSREFTKKIAKKLNMNPDEATGFDVLVMSAFMHSLKGKGDILKQVWERIEGAIPKSMTLDFDDPVQVYIDSMRNATEPERPDAPVEDEQGASDAPQHESDEAGEDVGSEPADPRPPSPDGT